MPELEATGARPGAEPDRARVAAVIEEIREALQAHGGDVELVDIQGGIVKVRLKGACQGCPGARMTIEMGVQRRLQEVVPEVAGVQAI